jgi:hypothetical protein
MCGQVLVEVGMQCAWKVLLDELRVPSRRVHQIKSAIEDLQGKPLVLQVLQLRDADEGGVHGISVLLQVN